jgi:hypothetical protein
MRGERFREEWSNFHLVKMRESIYCIAQTRV